MLAVISVACASASIAAPKPRIRIGSTNFTEQVILAELYGQALEANGYRVDRKLRLGNREIVAPALEAGEIDMYPEYLASAERYQAKQASQASPDPAASHRALRQVLKAKAITALDYAPAFNQNELVVTQAMADRYSLKRTSDLKPVAGQLVLGGPLECPTRPSCIPGLERAYGIRFKDFKPLDTGGAMTVASLAGNQVDVAVLLSTTPAISLNRFVLLDDDLRLQAAENIVPVVRDDWLDRAPDSFEQSVNRVSARLTTEGLTELNKQVEIERREPKDAAAAWLKTNGITH